VCLPLLIFHCTIKSRGSLLAPAHPGGLGKRAVKQLWCVVWWCLIRSASVVCCVGIDVLHCEFADSNKINIDAHISALTMLVGRQEGHPARKKIWGDGGGGHWLLWIMYCHKSTTSELETTCLESLDCHGVTNVRKCLGKNLIWENCSL